MDFVLADVGGQTHEMKTWEAEMGKVGLCGIIFICSLADFNRPGLHTPVNFFAEHFFGSNALHCTAMARTLIPAECSAVS